nr:tyrosine-type recombinase/integrase [Sulfoacidibacillus thermotolerans]
MGARDKVMLTLLLHTGLRLQEFIQLQLKDVDLTARQLTVRQGKGAKDRTLPLSQAIATQVQNYIKQLRPAFLKVPSEALFLSKKGRPFHPTAFREKIYFYAKKAGLHDRRVYPHTFRSTFATLLVRQAGADLTVIKELMGHTNIQTTARYVRVVEAEKRKAVEEVITSSIILSVLDRGIYK